MFAADNMVDLATPKSVILVYQTVLADMVSTLGHLSAQPFAHITGHE